MIACISEKLLSNRKEIGILTPSKQIISEWVFTKWLLTSKINYMQKHIITPRTNFFKERVCKQGLLLGVRLL